MRASNFSLVIATGSLLWASGAWGQSSSDTPPTGVGSNTKQGPLVFPLTSTQGEPYTVSWNGCHQDCSVLYVSLVEVETFTSVSVQTNTVPIEGVYCMYSTRLRPP
jgi:hypothetical protein